MGAPPPDPQAGLEGAPRSPFSLSPSSTVGHRSRGLDSKAEMPFWEAQSWGGGEFKWKRSKFLKCLGQSWVLLPRLPAH